ncbi:hypothetical protein [Nannocystis punicea]|uniref:DUF4189 domain-containing protein n=1 Tax=Nannocystis punicea TaxID=2995304 RepID=A0ABY7H8D3_9BACT|nr:hypothetical protein [Nannocystis poenicansa]WAS95418.1 hypothetical protein O0S08_04595 [Nannocystis poenicansa]
MREERKSTPVASALWLAACLAACGGGSGSEAAPSKPASPKTEYRCSIQVSKTASEFTGKGNGEDPAKADEAAWTDVCAKLPEAERATCRDETKWTVTKSSMSASGGGPTSHSTTLALVAIAPMFEGEAFSEASSDEACKAALADACTKAGSPGDCLAAGFEKKGEARTKKTQMSKN